MVARPRTPTERSRASRLRARERAGARLTPEEAAWLRAYERAVADARAWRQAHPTPRVPRPRTPTERARASRYRAVLARGGTLTAAQLRWLERYEATVTAARRARRARAARRRARSAAGDALAAARALAEWLVGAEDAAMSRAQVHSGSSGAWAQVPVSAGVLPELGMTPDLVGVLSGSRAMTARVELVTPAGRRWVTVLAYTDDLETAERDIADAIDEAAEAYLASGISAVAVFVGG